MFIYGGKYLKTHRSLLIDNYITSDTMCGRAKKNYRIEKSITVMLDVQKASDIKSSTF